jgi:hypothetical protein
VKSLKKFGLNLSLKVWFEKSLKKKRKKKENLPLHPFGPATQQPTNLSPAAAHATGSFFYSFYFADEPAPPISLSPVAFLSSSPPLPRPARRRRKSCRARPPSPSFPPRSSRPIKAVNPRVFNPAVSLSLAPARDDRGHQWQAPAAA